MASNIRPGVCLRVRVLLATKRHKIHKKKGLSRMKQRMSLSLATACCLITAGCGDATSPRVLALRSQFLVASAPEKERPVPDVRNDLKSGELKPDTAFVVRARINAGDFPPFADGKAAFIVTDATGHDGDESHDPHECPFCKRDIKSVIARVEFDDEAGRMIDIDARELFNLKEFDLLVIEGRGQFDEDDMLVVAASKIFVSR